MVVVVIIFFDLLLKMAKTEKTLRLHPQAIVIVFSLAGGARLLRGHRILVGEKHFYAGVFFFEGRLVWVQILVLIFLADVAVQSFLFSGF